MVKVKELSKEDIEVINSIKPLDLKEPSIEIRQESNTTKLPKHSKRKRDLDKTKVYNRIECEDIDNTNYDDKYNKMLNILLVIMIVILVIIISIACVLGLQLLGVL